MYLYLVSLCEIFGKDNTTLLRPCSVYIAIMLCVAYGHDLCTL